MQRTDATACENHLADPFSVRSTELAQRGPRAAAFEWTASDPSGSLSLADNPTLSVFSAGPFTIAVWFKMLGTDPAAAGKLLAKGYQESQGAHEVGFEYQVGGNCDGGPRPHMHVGVYGVASGATSCVPTEVFDPSAHVDEWHFMMMSHDHATKTLSVQIDDGAVFSKSTAGFEIADTTAALNLGGFTTSTQAALDDVMIWNRLLTREEKTSVFTNALTCP